MPRPYQLQLSVAQTADLRDLRDHARLAYLRERAAVLLAIAGDCWRLLAAARSDRRRVQQA